MFYDAFCISCYNSFNAVPFVNGECPYCGQKYGWDEDYMYDAEDNIIDSRYTIEWEE